jgi:hypothetical protein
LPSADELVAGRIYYSVHYAGAEAMYAPVVISLLYAGSQDEEGQYVFLPLPLSGTTEIRFELGALEARILDLEQLRRTLAHNAS